MNGTSMGDGPITHNYTGTAVPIGAQNIQGSDADLLKHHRNVSKRVSNGEPPAVTEAVLGDSNSAIPVKFLEALHWAIEGVVVVLDENGKGIGSGAMISPELFITNNHVLSTPEEAAKCLVGFRFIGETSDDGKKKGAQAKFAKVFDKCEVLELDPKTCFVSSHRKALDFTIVAVKDAKRTVFHPLSSETKVIGGTPKLFILGHPNGKIMQASLQGQATKVIDNRYLLYTNDTEHGSSGSPVFNRLWNLIAIHHEWVCAENAKGEWLKKDGTIFDQDVDDENDLKFIANKGVSASAILGFVKQHIILNHAKSETPKFRLLRQLFEQDTNNFNPAGKNTLELQLAKLKAKPVNVPKKLKKEDAMDEE